jgi:hypothetical protein
LCAAENGHVVEMLVAEVDDLLEWHIHFSFLPEFTELQLIRRDPTGRNLDGADRGHAIPTDRDLVQ